MIKYTVKGSSTDIQRVAHALNAPMEYIQTAFQYNAVKAANLTERLKKILVVIEC